MFLQPSMTHQIWVHQQIGNKIVVPGSISAFSYDISIRSYVRNKIIENIKQNLVKNHIFKKLLHYLFWKYCHENEKSNSYKLHHWKEDKIGWQINI